jgi:hypothetical protein
MNRISVRGIFLMASIFMIGFSCTKKDADQSLTVDEYVKRGVPDPGREWSINDFRETHRILGSMKWERPYQLPVKDSKRSGALFERMLSLENMSFLHDSTLSFSEKAERISAFINVCDYWADVYSNPVIDRYYQREQIDIQIFTLNVTESMLNLATEIYQSDDPTAAALKYGYKTIKKDYLYCLANELKTQSRTSQFRQEDLNRLADSVYRSVTRNKEWMDSSAIKDVKRSLRLVMDSTSSDYIRHQYTTLEKLL